MASSALSVVSGVMQVCVVNTIKDFKIGHECVYTSIMN